MNIDEIIAAITDFCSIHILTSLYLVNKQYQRILSLPYNVSKLKYRYNLTGKISTFGEFIEAYDKCSHDRVMDQYHSKDISYVLTCAIYNFDKYSYDILLPIYRNIFSNPDAREVYEILKFAINRQYLYAVERLLEISRCNDYQFRSCLSLALDTGNLLLIKILLKDYKYGRFIYRDTFEKIVETGDIELISLALKCTGRDNISNILSTVTGTDVGDLLHEWLAKHPAKKDFSYNYCGGDFDSDDDYW